jgi:hypothetical protein
MRLFKQDVVDPPCSVKLGGAGPYANAVGFVNINWNSLLWQLGGRWWHPSNPGIITLPRDGLYLFVCALTFSAFPTDLIINGPGGRMLEVGDSASGAGATMSLQGLLNQAKGDQFSVTAWSTTTQTFGGTGVNVNHFEVIRLGDRK